MASSEPGLLSSPGSQAPMPHTLDSQHSGVHCDVFFLLSFLSILVLALVRLFSALDLVKTMSCPGSLTLLAQLARTFSDFCQNLSETQPQPYF